MRMFSFRHVPMVATALDLADFLDEELGFPIPLPDPDDAEMLDLEFQEQIDRAWQVCDRFDIQTEIWRGRILRSVRDREKNKGDSRGAGFLNWLKDREITKTRAYDLIELANSAESMMEQGHLETQNFNQFSKRAFIETAKAGPEVQQLISDVAKDGKRINRQQVKQIADEWTAVTSDLLPDIVRERAASHHLPPRYLAPLVREMEKLPEAHQTAIHAEIEETPDVDTVKQVTTSARYLSRYLEAAIQVQTIKDGTLDLEQALEEALRIDCLSLAADVVNQSAQVEQAMAKLYTSWKRLGGLSERLYVESGSSTPHLRQLLDNLGPLSGDSLSLPLGDATGRVIRIQILPDE
jgi:hypothetical protein